MFRKYSGRNRHLCRWDKWTRPTNRRSDDHWKKFNGYVEWKTNVWQKTLSTWGLNTWGNWGSWGSWGSWSR